MPLILANLSSRRGKRNLQQRQDVLDSLGQTPGFARRPAETDEKTNVPRYAVTNLAKAREVNDRSLNSDGMGLSR